MRTPKILVLDRSEALSEQIGTVTSELRPHPAITSCTRIAEVGDLLTDEGPFDVLVAGPSLGTRSGLSRLEIIHDELPAMAIVLAFSRRPEANLRDVVRTGANDLLQLPVEDNELVTCLERALDLSRRTIKEPVGVASASAPVPTISDAPREGALAKVVTVASATGGCGKTFYATNLAAFLRKHKPDQRVCIVDLDLQFGEVSTGLRLRPRFTIFDALQRDDDDQANLEAHIEEYLVAHETGISVLAAPKDPSEADKISTPDVTRIIEALRSRFDWVIVDTPAQLSEVVLAAFDQSELLYILATLDLPSIRNMGVFLSTLDKLKIPSEQVRLILNKAETDVGIDVPQIEKLFPQGFTSVLPYAKEVSRSINLGMPVLVSAPHSEVTRRMVPGMTELLPEQQRQQVVADGAAIGNRRFSRLFRRAAQPIV
jgi:pilus assembly protein CpaE